jgi:hypothetical protein
MKARRSCSFYILGPHLLFIYDRKCLRFVSDYLQLHASTLFCHHSRSLAFYQLELLSFLYQVYPGVLYSAYHSLLSSIDMHFILRLAALGCLFSTATAEYTQQIEAPFPTSTSRGNPMPIGTGTGIGTIGPIVTGTGTLPDTATGPISTGSPALPQAGNVHFINDCPYPLYISTNVTSAMKPFKLGGAYTNGKEDLSFEFELLNPAQTYKPVSQPTATVDASVTSLVSALRQPAPTVAAPRRRGASRYRNPHGHQWNETESLGVDVIVSPKLESESNTDTSRDQGRIEYYAHDGTYKYQIRANSGFLDGRKAQIVPGRAECETVDGEMRKGGSCAWSSDMWITFCVGYWGK